MKAAKFQQFGDPEKVLFVSDHVLSPPDDDAVRIKVLLGNVNISDMALIRGKYNFFPEFPSLAGAEGVGTVLETGKNISAYAVGDKVSFYSLYGAWAEEVNVPQKSLVRIPEELEDEVAAQFYTNPITAVAMLEEAGSQEGDFLLLTAGASSVSKLIIQFARQSGIRVIATVRHDSLCDELLELGAFAVVNTETDNLIREVQRVTEAKGVSVVLDAVGGKTASEAFHCLSPGGKMIVYGALSGERIPLNSSALIAKDISISSFWTHRWFDRVYEGFPEKYLLFKQALIAKMSALKLKMPVEQIYPLQDIRQAAAHFARRGRSGKILIKP